MRRRSRQDRYGWRSDLRAYDPASSSPSGCVEQLHSASESRPLSTRIGSFVSTPALAQSPATGPKPMTYAIKLLPFDPKSIKGLSEKILTSHYENNYSGAVKRLNAITEQLAGLDYTKAPVFVIN